MAHLHNSITTTKSIDVGGVFLMDLSVNEASELSELCEHSMIGHGENLRANNNNNNNTHNHHHRGQSNSDHNLQQIYDTTTATSNKPTSHNLLLNRISQATHVAHPHQHNQHHHNHQDKPIRLSPTAYGYTSGITNTSSRANNRCAPQVGARQLDEPIGTAGSLEGLASVINCDRQHGGGRPTTRRTTTTTTTTAATTTTTTMRPCELDEDQLSSLSDESYLPTSSGTSLSVSLTGSSELEEFGPLDGRLDNDCDQRDKDSTTAREDSGVLDMKDLGGGGGGGGGAGSCEPGGQQQQPQPQPQPQHQEPRQIGDNDHGKREQQVVVLLLPHSPMREHQQQVSPGEPGQEKSISANIMATNLINKTANGNMNTNVHHHHHHHHQHHHQHHHRAAAAAAAAAADGSSNKQQHQTCNTHNQCHNQHQQLVTPQARSNARGITTTWQRSTVSASLPIQVPARQMKKNLNRMKLKLKLIRKDIRDEEPGQQQVAINGREGELDELSPSPPPPPPPPPLLPAVPMVRRGDRNRPAFENITAFCGQDDDAFLEQEFNANHHNHYPIDELDSEHLTAEEDPMRLFASIQALAKSLHEDAELFGSLPPKRMLESPIRSLALA